MALEIEADRQESADLENQFEDEDQDSTARSFKQFTIEYLFGCSWTHKKATQMCGFLSGRLCFSTVHRFYDVQ